MVTALYAINGDPILKGNVDIIQRISNLSEKVFVCLRDNPNETCTFSLEQRKCMAKSATSRIANVEIVSIERTYHDFAYEQNIDVIYKGIWDFADADSRKTSDEIAKALSFGIETCFLNVRPKYADVGCDRVKTILLEQGDIHKYVPLNVKEALEREISSRYFLGITGAIGCGKSYVAREFVKLGKRNSMNVYHIEMDKIGHQILGGLKEPVYEQIRETIVSVFGEKLRKADGSINRSILGPIVFSDPLAMEKLNEIMYTPMLVRLRKALHRNTGIILIDSALLAESKGTYVCNNNVLMVNAKKEIQKSNIHGRGRTGKQIKNRIESQFSCEEKRARVAACIEKENHGKIWVLDNSNHEISRIKEMFNDIFGELIADPSF